MIYAISFKLHSDFWSEIKDNVNMDIQINNILKENGFKQQEKTNLYLSDISNSVLTILTAQKLCKLVGFSKYVSNFNMFRIDEITSLDLLKEGE